MERQLLGIIGKVCKKCGEKKPLSSFYKNKLCKDGYIGSCKTCKNKYHRKNYRKRKRAAEKLATKTYGTETTVRKRRSSLEMLYEQIRNEVVEEVITHLKKL